MARYIDADKLYQETEKKIKAENSQGLAVMDDEFLDIIDNAPTEDVVLRGHLDQVRWERDVAIEQLEEIGLSFGEKTDGYGNLTEYAREIFEEIQKIFVHRILHNESQYFEGVLDNITKDLDELKKKYTESEGKG